MNPKQIYFCHPHTGSDDPSTADLLEAFFQSVASSHAKDCSVHIIRVRGGDYELNKPEEDREFHLSKNSYDFIEHYKKLYGFYEIYLSGFELKAKHRFNQNRYPGYSHVRTNDDSNSAAMVGRNNSLEYVFKRNKDANEGSDSEYNSEEIYSDDESESELAFKLKL